MPDVLISKAALGELEAVHKLLLRGAVVNCRSSRETTPLIIAAFHGHAETVELLIRSKANLDSVTRLGRSALLCAASNLDTSPEIRRATVMKLLAYGADPYLTDSTGDAPERHNIVAEVMDSLDLREENFRVIEKLLGIELETGRQYYTNVNLAYIKELLHTAEGSADSSWLASRRSFNLSSFTPQALRAIAAAGPLRALEKVYLCDDKEFLRAAQGGAALTQFLGSCRESLRCIFLSYTGVMPEALRAVAAAGPFLALEAVDLSGNKDLFHKAEGGASLLQLLGSCQERLLNIDLKDTGATPEALRAVAAAKLRAAEGRDRRARARRALTHSAGSGESMPFFVP